MTVNIALLEAILEEASEKEGDRFTLYRVAADHAEDTGRPRLAEGLRWLAETGREPQLRIVGPWQHWTWWVQNPAHTPDPGYWVDNPEYIPICAEPDLRIRADGSRKPPVFTKAGNYPSRYWYEYRDFAVAVLDAAFAVAIDRHGECD